MPTVKIISIVQQVTAALAYLHDPNKKDDSGEFLPAVIHHDLKLHNILISRDGSKYLVADFGLCKEGTEAKTGVGTTVYRAPETF